MNTKELQCGKPMTQMQKISRVGVYAVIRDGRKMLLVIQPKGPYANRYDFPGGGIEFGETIEQTLRRELLEEIGMEFTSMKLLTNLTTQITGPSYLFHQIGLIYAVEGLKEKQEGALKHEWVDVGTLKEENVSPFVWEILKWT